MTIANLLFAADEMKDASGVVSLGGIFRRQAMTTIRKYHYTHSVPAGKTHWFLYESALLAWSIPANKNISGFLLGQSNRTWELSRLWAPDGHAPNLLSSAIAKTVKALRRAEPSVAAVVAYADPNVGHEGGVYRAASWLYCGQCEDNRRYVDGNGQTRSRRAFHSGAQSASPADILARGYKMIMRPGKHRFALGLRKWSRKALRCRFG